MKSIRWGTNSGADINTTFNGNVTLDDARIINSGAADDDLAIDWWTPILDSNTRHLYTFDSDYKTDYGTAGIDLVYEYGSQSHVWNTTDPYQGAGDVDYSYNSVTRSNIPSDSYHYNSTEGATYEAMAYCVVDTSERTLFFSYNVSGNLCTMCRFNYNSNPGQLVFFIDSRGIATTGVSTGWHHIAVVADTTSTRLYVDGTLAKTGTVTAGYNHSGNIRVGRNATNATRFWNAKFDSLALHTTNRYTSNFYAGRYTEYGSAILNYTGLSGKKPTSISWNSTITSTDKIYQIYVNGASGWTQVGGDNPSSPIAVSGETLASDDAVKVVMTPSTNTIHDDTPVLDWLQMDYSAVSNRVVLMNII